MPEEEDDESIEDVEDNFAARENISSDTSNATTSSDQSRSRLF